MTHNTESTYAPKDVIERKKDWRMHFFFSSTLFALAILFSQIDAVFSFPDSTNENNVFSMGMSFSHYGSILINFIANLFVVVILFFFIYQFHEGKRFFKLSDINKTIFYRNVTKGIMRVYAFTFIALYLFDHYGEEGFMTPANILSIVILPIIIQVVYHKFFIKKMIEKDKNANIPDAHVEE